MYCIVEAILMSLRIFGL